MLDTVFGLPVHSLAVHGAVVLLPLAAIGAVLIAARARWSKRFGVIVVVVALVGTGFAVLSEKSGETLAARVGTPEPHAELGERLPLIAAVFALVVVVFWLFDRGVPGDRRRPPWLVALAVLVVIASVVVTWWTIRVGHSGAEAVWKSIIDNAPAP